MDNSKLKQKKDLNRFSIYISLILSVAGLLVLLNYNQEIILKYLIPIIIIGLFLVVIFSIYFFIKRQAEMKAEKDGQFLDELGKNENNLEKLLEVREQLVSNSKAQKDSLIRLALLDSMINNYNNSNNIGDRIDDGNILKVSKKISRVSVMRIINSLLGYGAFENGTKNEVFEIINNILSIDIMNYNNIDRPSKITSEATISKIFDDLKEVSLESFRSISQKK